MKLILLNNYSEDNFIFKRRTKIVELQGQILEQTSLIQPSIRVYLEPSVIEGYVVTNEQAYITYSNEKILWDRFLFEYILRANYAYIPDFHRYYYINDIVSIRTNLWQVNMSVDVLMSYSSEILNLDAFVTRNEFEYDAYVKDDLMTFDYNKEVIEEEPVAGPLVNKSFDTSQQPVNNNIVISVINDTMQYTMASAASPDASLPVVNGIAAATNLTSRNYATFATAISRLANRLVSDDSNLANFILSIMVFPFTLETTGSDIPLRLGTTDMTESSAGANDEVDVALMKSEGVSDYFVIADFTISSNSFLDYEPFTKYEIYLPYVGWIPLSADDILDKNLIVYYVVDYSTGTAQVTIYDIDDDKIIYTGNTQLGVKVGITSTNQREVNDNRNSNNIGLGVGLLTSAVSMIAGIVTYNPVAVAGGAISAGSSIAKFVHNSNTNYLRANGSVTSGSSGLYLPQGVRIRKTRMIPRDYDENYFKLFGRPLNKYMKLSNLTGYTQVGDVHLEDISTATKAETDAIKTLLEEGIII